jgi:Zn-finger nucleic acid-binding protein
MASSAANIFMQNVFLESDLPDRDRDIPVVLREPASSRAAIGKRNKRAMKCPIDNTELVISSRDGVEIDYCPQCRGVWLDRGELDKIIERSMPTPQRATSDPQRSRRDDDDDDDDDDRDRDDRPRRRKRRSFLSDIFDF